MKKNTMMRLASFLLIAVLITTSAISGTYAKYTTQDSASDTARVAKWGVELQVVGNLYGDSYGADDKIVKEDATGISVQSNEFIDGIRTDVVAPGTANDAGFTFSLTGKPEVSGKVSATIKYENIYLNAGTYGVMVPVAENVITEGNYREFAGLYTKGDDNVYSVATGYTENTQYYTLEDEVHLIANYFPVEYCMIGNGSTPTSYNNPYSNEALSIDTLKGLSETIGACFGVVEGTATVEAGKTTVTYSGTTFGPNADLANVVKLGKQEINWKWDFCQANETTDGDAACDACKADTILGNLMAGNELNGEVVKLDGTTYKAPVAATGVEAKDYNLETEFSIDITVTQVD